MTIFCDEAKPQRGWTEEARVRAVDATDWHVALALVAPHALVLERANPIWFALEDELEHFNDEDEHFNDEDDA